MYYARLTLCSITSILWYLVVVQVSASRKTLLFLVSGIAQVVKTPATNHSPDTRNKQHKGKEGQRKTKGTTGMCERKERERDWEFHCIRIRWFNRDTCD